MDLTEKLSWRKPVSWTMPEKLPERSKTSLRDARITKYRMSDEFFEQFLDFKNIYIKDTWKLPDAIYNSTSYEIETFQVIREDIRNLKVEVYNKITNYNWKQTSDQFTLTIYVIDFLKAKKFDLVSKNWCKFLEIFKTYPVIKSGKINTAHIENGGYTTSALNHYLHSTFTEVDWNWKAIALNPYHEDTLNSTINDDRIISGNIKNWCFGKDFTGNILDPDNIDAFAEECKSIGEIDLAITSATQGFNMDLENFELNSYDIQFSGLVTALKVLAKGGNLIMTSYTLLSAKKISLMYLLNTVFEEVHMFKPCSGPLTSFEFYVICLNFKKDDKVEVYLEEMKRRVGKGSWDKSPLFPLDAIPGSFLQEHEKIMRFFEKIWKNYTLKFNNFYENPTNNETKQWRSVMNSAAGFWFVRKFEVGEPIPFQTKNKEKAKKNCIDYRYVNDNECCLRVEHLKTFDEKSLCEQLLLLNAKFKVTKSMCEWPFDTEPIIMESLNAVDLILKLGKQVQKVRRTFFVVPSTLYLIVGQIEAKYGKCIVEYFPQNEISCQFDENVSIVYDFNSNYGVSEKEFLKQVLQKWSRVEPSKITFKNFLFLTHFSTSFLRILASFYRTMTIGFDGTIRLENLKEEKWILKTVGDLNEHLNSSSSENIFCLTELKDVNQGFYFKHLTIFNSQLLITYLTKAFDFLTEEGCKTLED
ncbi:CMTR2.2 family protein [Megaselia abdita]